MTENRAAAIGSAHATSPYDDLVTRDRTPADCRATGDTLRLAQAAVLATRAAPSLHFDEQPGERPKRGIEISEATARLAAAVYGD